MFALALAPLRTGRKPPVPNSRALLLEMLSFIEFLLGSCSESCVFVITFPAGGWMVRLVFHVPHGFAFLGSQLVSALFTRDLHPFLAPSRSREVGHCF